MENNQVKSPIFQFKVRKAIQILTENIESIPDVQSWAKEAGVSTRWLCKAIKIECGNSPKVFIRNKRFKILVKSLTEDPELSGYYLAREIGLRDDKALYKFLSTHYNTTLTQMREELIKDRFDE